MDKLVIDQKKYDKFCCEFCNNLYKDIFFKQLYIQNKIDVVTNNDVNEKFKLLLNVVRKITPAVFTFDQDEMDSIIAAGIKRIFPPGIFFPLMTKIALKEIIDSDGIREELMKQKGFIDWTLSTCSYGEFLKNKYKYKPSNLYSISEWKNMVKSIVVKLGYNINKEGFMDVSSEQWLISNTEFLTQQKLSKDYIMGLNTYSSSEVIRHDCNVIINRNRETMIKNLQLCEDVSSIISCVQELCEKINKHFDERNFYDIVNSRILCILIICDICEVSSNLNIDYSVNSCDPKVVKFITDMDEAEFEYFISQHLLSSSEDKH